MTERVQSSRLVGHLRRQAEHCQQLGSPLYADLLQRIAGDIQNSGAFDSFLSPWADRPATDLIPLRLLGGVHALVLGGQAPDLASFYPSVGGVRADAEARWRAFTHTVAEQGEQLLPWFERAPQTNEVGRATALLGALHWIQNVSGGRPVRLFEFGSSAGLNLWVDQLPIGSSVPDANHPLRIIQRSGVDLHPIDASSGDGRRRLRAYVWPDDVARMRRLDAALEAVAGLSSPVRQGSAADFVESIDLEEGALTVLWHSVTWLYLSAEEQERITAHLKQLVPKTTPDAALAHVSFELPNPVPAGQPRCHLEVRLAPPRRVEILGDGPAHGVPMTWRDPLPT